RASTARCSCSAAIAYLCLRCCAWRRRYIRRLAGVVRLGQVERNDESKTDHAGGPRRRIGGNNLS
ncbi:unnamed protein product, partial [Amoebophrya sp. A120]